MLDEEHESTFKQETAPRYHARDVALRRAADQNVPLVLASATPSLESWHRAQRGEYQLVEMPRRVLDLPLPAVRRSICATKCTASHRAARSAGRCTGRWTRRCATAGK